jgi:hypothetical protein
MPVSFSEALDVVQRHSADLKVADPSKYIADFAAYLETTPEDRRAAVTMAVDASKSLMNIGVVFFGAVGAFILSYSSTHTWRPNLWPVILLCLAGLASVLSMWAGFIAIGIGYQRGQRPADPAGAPWSTKPLSPYLRNQSILGLLALALFASGVVLWHGSAGQDGLSVRQVATGSAAPATPGALKIEGEWTHLMVRHGQVEATLAPTGPGQTNSFEISTEVRP